MTAEVVTGELFVLGPVELYVDGRKVDLGGLRQETVLGVLALGGGRPLPIEQLVDAVWQSPPATATKQIRNAVSSLRRPLATASASIERVGSGYYRLEADRLFIDVDQFLARGERARELAAAGHTAEAIVEYRAALARWRGPMRSAAAPEVGLIPMSGLHEHWLQMAEECVDLQIAEGRERELVDELYSLVAGNPFRERLTVQLMRVLANLGARAQALMVYERIRRQLADELGVDPGEELAGMHRYLLGGASHRVRQPEVTRAVAEPLRRRGTGVGSRSSGLRNSTGRRVM